MRLEPGWYSVGSGLSCFPSFVYVSRSVEERVLPSQAFFFSGEKQFFFCKWNQVNFLYICEKYIYIFFLRRKKSFVSNSFFFFRGKQLQNKFSQACFHMFLRVFTDEKKNVFKKRLSLQSCLFSPVYRVINAGEKTI